MGPGIDKLFLELKGRPVLAHAWGAFDKSDCIDEIVLVVREGLQAAFTDIAREFQFTKPYRIVIGGRERQDSVWNGVQAVSERAEIVAIHDAARPCVTAALIEATISAARQAGAAVAAQPVTDTIKESLDGRFVSKTLDRSRLWAVQTPQTFKVDIIKRALEAAIQRGLILTDDTAACELIGQEVKLVNGGQPNPKVTRPEDLPFIASFL